MSSENRTKTMYDCFLEIAFEADLNTEENAEMLELSKELCNEYVETRSAVCAELREMIYERNQCTPLRTDDAYLLRFLRARGFVVPRAHALLVRYCKFRAQNSYLYDSVDMWSLTKVKGAYEGTLYDHPDTGRLTVFRFGVWDPYEFPVTDLVRAGMLIMEIGLRTPKIQVLGGTVIVDMEGLSLKHVSTLTPTIAYQIVSLMGAATAARLRACHIINYNWLLNTFFYIFKRFIPQNSWDRIHFHGSDLSSLQKHISKDILPVRYGGTCRSLVPIGLWLEKVKKYRDEKFDKDMKELGYLVKE